MLEAIEKHVFYNKIRTFYTRINFINIILIPFTLLVILLFEIQILFYNLYLSTYNLNNRLVNFLDSYDGNNIFINSFLIYLAFGGWFFPLFVFVAVLYFLYIVIFVITYIPIRVMLILANKKYKK